MLDEHTLARITEWIIKQEKRRLTQILGLTRAVQKRRDFRTSAALLLNGDNNLSTMLSDCVVKKKQTC